MKLLTTLGIAVAAVAWSWLAIRYLGKGDTTGGIIFLVTAVMSAVLFVGNLIKKNR